MAAVLKLSEEKTEEICGRFRSVYPVNYNCPGQISVSGGGAEKKEFLEAVKEAGGRAVVLNVSGAFHSPFMEQAAKDFEAELKNVPFQETKIRLYSDLTAKPYEGDPARLLSQQICSPVRWERLIRNMVLDGADTFVEIGPGRTLANMIRKISPDAAVFSMEEYLAEVEGC